MADECSQMIWQRQWPASTVNFDLVLSNPDMFEFERATTLLDETSSVSHRGVTLNASAANEFRRWFREPTSPLRACAYVGLSNWFLTAGGDATSNLARRCEKLWDYLFAMRPPRRLSSAEKGRNLRVLSEPFNLFWSQLVEKQGNSSISRPSSPALRSADDSRSGPDLLKTKITVGALRCEVEGCPDAIAELITLLDRWNTSHDSPSTKKHMRNKHET